MIVSMKHLPIVNCFVEDPAILQDTSEFNDV